MAPPRGPDRLRDAGWWALAEARRSLLQRVSRALAPHGVELVSIKGMHLAFEVAEFPWFRPMADADAVVVGAYSSIPALLGPLADLRFEVSWSSIAVTDGAGANLDLHRAVFPPFFGRLSPRALLASSRRSVVLETWIPCVEDAAVIAIGNYAKDRFGAIGHGDLAGDLRLLRHRGGLQVDALMRQLKLRDLFALGRLALADASATDASLEAWAQQLHPAGDLERARARVAWLRALGNLGQIAIAAQVDSPSRRGLGAVWSMARRIRADFRTHTRRNR